MAKILVIDDDASIRTLFQRFLSIKGHRVDCACDGREGLRMIHSDPPDLVITDIMMPEADGLEVVMAIQNGGSRIPVIAISGGGHTLPVDFLPVARNFGAQRVLYKPVELEELLAAVAEAV